MASHPADAVRVALASAVALVLVALPGLAHGSPSFTPGGALLFALRGGVTAPTAAPGACVAEPVVSGQLGALEKSTCHVGAEAFAVAAGSKQASFTSYPLLEAVRVGGVSTVRLWVADSTAGVGTPDTLRAVLTALLPEGRTVELARGVRELPASTAPSVFRMDLPIPARDLPRGARLRLQLHVASPDAAVSEVFWGGDYSTSRLVVQVA